jgi:HD-GYP domain-containing protein (c-di-GMP phosphodiesterase class II)
MSELEQARNCTLEVYGDAMALKSPILAAHSKRVTSFSIKLCLAMQMSALETREIARAAFLHDVGKLALPDSLLVKHSGFTDEEIQSLREHCLVGYQLVKKINFLASAADLIYCHHERWDGSGYPRGLKGERIPIGARVIAVVNLFDNLVFVPSNGGTMDVEPGMREIASRAGTELDPQIVTAFLNAANSIPKWSISTPEPHRRRS